jgi:hypothetical protein
MDLLLLKLIPFFALLNLCVLGYFILGRGRNLFGLFGSSGVICAVKNYY